MTVIFDYISYLVLTERLLTVFLINPYNHKSTFTL